MRHRVTLALVLMGFTSLVVQTLLIREFFITFYGNELTIGLIFAVWIVSEAMGSGLASRFSERLASPFLTYSLLQILISIYLPLSIFLIRYIKNLMPLVTGESVGLIPIISSCLLIVGPISVFDGMQFPIGCRIYRQTFNPQEKCAGKVYILEAVGFILAGPIFTYVLLTKFHSFNIAFLVGFINLLSAFFLIREEPFYSLKNAYRVFISLLIALNLYFMFSGASFRLNKYSVKKQWKNQDIVDYQNSIYGNLAVSRIKEQYTFYSNGIPIINIPTPDVAWTQEFVHFSLLSHPSPKKILFLGGGAGGFIREALKYPVERIDYAELDPLLIKLLKKFPKDITENEINDWRVNLNITDGVRLVKETPLKYDVVFINLPFPSTLQLNRYYTKEFFGSVKKILNKDGILVLSLPGSLSYLNNELKQLNLCILTTLKVTFKGVSVIPGYQNIYISSQAPVEINPENLMQRAAERKIYSSVLDIAHLEDRLKKYWQDWFYQTLNKTSPIKINENLIPSGGFYGIAYWNSLFNPYVNRFLRATGDLNFGGLLLYAIFFAVVLFILKGFFRIKEMGVAVAITTTGFFGMSFNLILLLSYQIFFGYIYSQIALMVTSFMAGLTLGGWAITNNLHRIKRNLTFFIAIEMTIAVFCLFCGLFLTYINGIKEFVLVPVFYILSAITGSLVGIEFPLANRLYKNGDNPGMLYALDLFGGFFSALLVPILLVPIFGVLKTALFLVLLKAAGLTLFIPNSRRLG